MEKWLSTKQDKVWDELVASRLAKRFNEPKHLLMLKKAASLFKGKSAIDIGCGFAQLSQFLPEGIEYVGVDQSEPMLKKAYEAFPDARLINGNIYDLEIRKFDTVFAIDFLHHQPDLEPAFSNLMSLTKRRLIISLWIWGRVPKAKKKYLGYHGEIISWNSTEDLEKRFSGLCYKKIEKVGRKWRDIYYFDMKKEVNA